MTEQIYIDGELLDLDAKQKGVQLVFQSPYFTDFKSIVSNRTNTINVPKTARNMRILGYAGTQVSTIFPYRSHKVIYKRDGVQLFAGTATILGVKESAISLCLTWGNNEVFEPMFNTDLSALKALGERYANQYRYNATNDYSAWVQTGLTRKVPAVKTAEILRRMQTYFGISGLERLEQAQDTAVAVLTRKGDAVTEALQAFKYGTQEAVVSGFTTWQRINIATSGIWQTYYATGRATIAPNTATGQDLNGQYDDNTALIDISNASKISLHLDAFSAQLQYFHVMDSLRQQVVGQIGEERFGLFVLLMDSTGDTDPMVIDLVGGFISKQSEDYSYYTRDMGTYSAPAQDIDIDTNGYAYMALSFVAGKIVQPSASHWTGVSNDRRMIIPVSGETINWNISFIEDKGSEKEVIWGTGLNSLPMYANLPTISCGQFVKNIMLLNGFFAYCKRDKEITLTTLADLYNARSRVIDWTDKLVSVSERKTTLNDNARMNWLRYAEDEGVPKMLDFAMLVDDETINAERDLFVSDFAPAYGNYIPMWQNNDDGEVEFLGDSRKPRLLQGYNRGVGVREYRYDNSQSFVNIVIRKYGEYQLVIANPVVLSVEVLMSTADLLALDMTAPVYLKQTGRHYCIKQLTTKNGTLCNATLIQL